MRKFILPIFMAFLMGAATLGFIQIVRGQGANTPTILNSETQDDNRREIQSDAQLNGSQQPNISFIESPSATCYQPDPGQDQCFLTWYYLSVNGGSNYMITMTLSLNNTGPVAHTQGFFQTSMYIPYSMLGDGVQVACGALGAGGNPQLGNAYGYTIRARDSSGASSANYGLAFCPAYQP